jgi:hypothetical protein
VPDDRGFHPVNFSDIQSQADDHPLSAPARANALAVGPKALVKLGCTAA